MLATYGFSLAGVSSVEMPTTCSPSLPYLFWNSTNHGISILQGPHHVAQKSSSTTLPFSEARLTSLPPTSFSAKFRFAGLAFAAHALVAGAAADLDASIGSKCVSDDTFSVSPASARHATAGNTHRMLISLSSRCWGLSHQLLAPSL